MSNLSGNLVVIFSVCDFDFEIPFNFAVRIIRVGDPLQHILPGQMKYLRGEGLVNQNP